MVLVQNRYKNTLCVLRTHITFVMHSSPLCYITLRTQVIRLDSGNLGPQNTGCFLLLDHDSLEQPAWCLWWDNGDRNLRMVDDIFTDAADHSPAYQTEAARAHHTVIRLMLVQGLDNCLTWTGVN